jgi:hypothetical protein
MFNDSMTHDTKGYWALHRVPQGSQVFLYVALDASGGAAVMNGIKWRGGLCRQRG